MFFSLALLSFEDTYIDILSTEDERDDTIKRDVSISGLESSKMTVCRKIIETRTKSSRDVLLSRSPLV